ncbi:TPA: TIGR00270 family protein [Candidatus Micrarchaeota archaeon]|nr:TIGR00270 family protein [Candidatus Micrarchaeota archaeon]
MRETDCDICGRPAIGEAFVEGARVWVCMRCSQHGRMITRKPAPAPKGMGTAIRAKPVAAPELELAENYGTLLKKAREGKGLNLEQLGQQVGIRAQEIQRMEEQKLKPPEKDRIKLESFLKIRLIVQASEAEKKPEDLAKTLEGMRGRGGNAVTLADMVEIKIKKS